MSFAATVLPAWRGAPRRAFRAANRYSRVVDLLRFLLPLAAVGLVLLVVMWPQITGSYGGLIVPSLVRDHIDGVDVMRMHNPRYVGQTSSARPYAVTADSALLDPNRPNLVQLDQLAADIDTAERGALQLTAESGLYHRRTEQLELEGAIELATGDGYRFRTERADVDLKRSLVQGERPIAGAGPTGTLAADRFEIRDGGDVLWFEGRVKVTVRPRPQPDVSS